MFVPLHDDTPLRIIRFQYVTIGIILVNVVIYVVTGALKGEAALMAVSSGFGLVPADFTGAAPGGPAWHPVPEPLTLVTYMFLHAGWLHLISNMLFLWVFADNVEDAFGPLAFLFFYLVCGIIGGLVHIFMSPASPAPLIGASAAVSGVLGAYALLYPRARVWVLLFMRLPLRIGAAWVLGGWFLLQVINLFITGENNMQVAWWAHIGGFVSGLLITLLLRSRLLIRVGD